MAFNIDEFRSHLGAQNEFAHANRFDVTIAVPPFLVDQNYGRELVLSCESSELPGVDINQIEFKHYSFLQRVPHFLTFTPVTMIFLCTGKMKEKIFFDAWANGMVPFNTGLLPFTQDNSISTSITINQYNNVGEISYAAKLIEAYPISISTMVVSWSDESVNRLQVTFAFKKWLNLVPDGSTTSAAKISDPAGGINVNNTNSDVTNYTNIMPDMSDFIF